MDDISYSTAFTTRFLDLLDIGLQNSLLAVSRKHVVGTFFAVQNRCLLRFFSGSIVES